MDDVVVLVQEVLNVTVFRQSAGPQDERQFLSKSLQTSKSLGNYLPTVISMELCWPRMRCVDFQSEGHGFEIRQCTELNAHLYHDRNSKPLKKTILRKLGYY